MRGPKLTVGNYAPPHTPLSGKFLISEKCNCPAKRCVKFQLASPNSFRDTRESQIYTRDGAPHARPLAENFSFQKSAFDVSKCV